MADQGGYYPAPSSFPQQQQPYPPSQAYPPQQPYPPQEFPPETQPPPSYYQPQPPPTQQDTQTNVVVVQQQPQAVTAIVTHSYVADYGNGAMILAVFSSFCVCFFGSWLSLICTIPAIFFALNASSAGAAGNLGEAESQRNLSVGFSVAGVVSSVIFWIILIVIIATT